MNTRPRSARALTRVVTATALAVTLTGVAAHTTLAEGGKLVKTAVIRDACDPASFTAALGEGACVGDGHVTFDQLLASLAKGGSPKWRFQPLKATVKAGTVLHVVNRGGEGHSFTEVSAFGAGIVPPLNASLPPGTPDAVPVPGDPLFLDAGASADTVALTPGVHMFQCLIHPWMRSVITVKNS